MNTAAEVIGVNVTNLAACTAATDEWYYFPNNVSPTRIDFCPSTCTAISGASYVGVRYDVDDNSNGFSYSTQTGDATSDCDIDSYQDETDVGEHIVIWNLAGTGAVSSWDQSLRVTNAAACTGTVGEWHYDNNANINSMKMCPTTCTEFLSHSFAIEEFFDCVSGGSGNTVVEYEYTGTCTTPATHVQWTFLTYNTDPSGGSGTVNIEIRTGDTLAAMNAATFVQVAEANGADPEDCDPYTLACADIYAELDAALQATGEFAQIRFTLDSSGGTPMILEDWKLYYSCPFTE